MGNLIPVFVAFVLNCCGVYLFIDPKLSGCGPYVSMLIFNFAVFLLLWDVRLYPTSMRKLGTCCSNILQFLVAAILTEHLVSDFWLPLEEDLMHLLPKIADVEEELLRQGGFQCDTLTEFLRKEDTQIAASYALSLFFLFCVLHATRIIDLRLLRCSPKIFAQDITYRMKVAVKKARRNFGGVCGRKCVKWTAEDDQNMDDEMCEMVDSHAPSRHYPGNNNHRGGRSRHRRNHS